MVSDVVDNARTGKSLLLLLLLPLLLQLLLLLF